MEICIGGHGEDVSSMRLGSLRHNVLLSEQYRSHLAKVRLSQNKY
jgi:hypothetical protein